MNAEPDDQIECLELTGELDAQSLEALRLELRRLAKQHGVDVSEFRVDRLGPPVG